MTDADRIIIGAGISGLLAARRAVARGEHVLLLERGPRVGGLLQPTSVGSLIVDAGAEAFSTAQESCLRIIEELGMNESIVFPARTDARIVFSDTQRYQIPHGFLGVPSTLNDPELESIVSPHALAQARILDSLPLEDFRHFTVAELVEKRLGREFLDRLVDPLFLGVHGSSADQLLARRAMPTLLSAMEETGSLCAAAATIRSCQPRPGAAVAGLMGGLFTLTDALMNELATQGVRCVFSAEATSIESSPHGWQVRTPHSIYTSASLTVSTGVSHTQALISQLSTSPFTTQKPGSVDVVLVILEVESVQLNEFPLGSGALVSANHSATAKATTHVNAKWAWVQEQLPPNRHIIRLSYGRDGVLPEGNLIDYAAHDLNLLYGVSDAKQVTALEIPWPDSLFQANPESHELVRTLESVASEFEIELCGSYLSGNGLLGIIRDHYKRITP